MCLLQTALSLFYFFKKVFVMIFKINTINSRFKNFSMDNKFIKIVYINSFYDMLENILIYIL